MKDLVLMIVSFSGWPRQVSSPGQPPKRLNRTPVPLWNGTLAVRGRSFSGEQKGCCMTKRQLLEDIKADPARFFRAPNDVKRDRRFTDLERLEILQAWERGARALSAANDEGAAGGEPGRLNTVVAARMEVEKKLPAETVDRQSSKSDGDPVE
jgi:hypothetical protein